jgi:hypothetical protein
MMSCLLGSFLHRVLVRMRISAAIGSGGALLVACGSLLAVAWAGTAVEILVALSVFQCSCGLFLPAFAQLKAAMSERVRWRAVHKAKLAYDASILVSHRVAQLPQADWASNHLRLPMQFFIAGVLIYGSSESPRALLLGSGGALGLGAVITAVLFGLSVAPAPSYSILSTGTGAETDAESGAAT